MSITIYGNVTGGNVGSTIRNTTTTPARRRSLRIAARQIIRGPQHPRRNLQGYPQRRLLPSAHDDPGFWQKIHTLPENLGQYLTPEWRPEWLTRDVLRQLIWHFKPNQRIPCRMLKAAIIELYEFHVVYQYGAYYGI